MIYHPPYKFTSGGKISICSQLKQIDKAGVYTHPGESANIRTFWGLTRNFSTREGQHLIIWDRPLITHNPLFWINTPQFVNTTLICGDNFSNQAANLTCRTMGGKQHFIRQWCYFNSTPEIFCGESQTHKY